MNANDLYLELNRAVTNISEYAERLERKVSDLTAECDRLLEQLYEAEKKAKSE